MKYTITIFKIAILAILFTSCYSLKPTASTLTSPDYNSRAKVRGPGYVKRKNAIGITFNVAMIGAGGYAGYALAPFKHETEQGKQPTHVANIAVGAIVGAGVSFLTDAIMGKDERIVAPDVDKWIKQVNPEYRRFEGDKYAFSIIHSQADKSFVANNTTDLLDFKSAFPNSSRETELLQNTLSKISHSDLIAVITTYSENPSIVKYKEKYIDTSRSLTELLDGKRRYPDIKRDYESMSRTRLQDLNEVGLFYSTYPNSKYSNEIFKEQLKKIPKTDFARLVRIISPAVDKELVKQSKIDYICSFSDFNEVKAGMNRFQDISTKEILNELEKKGRLNDQKTLLTLPDYFSAQEFPPSISKKVQLAQQEVERKKEAIKRAEEEARQRAEEEAKRLNEYKRNSIGRIISWQEKISFDISSGGLTGVLESMFGIGSVSYVVEYEAIVESVIGDSSVKAIIKRCIIKDPDFVSMNYLKYKDSARSEINKKVGQTRVLSFSEFNLVK